MKSKSRRHKIQKRYIAPLSGGFMIISILGFLLSAYWIFDLDKTWGFTFCLVFTLMFVASLISMTYAPTSRYSFFREK